MCDYSLMALDNRLAECGEELVTHRFEFGTTGLAPATEVCEMNRRREEPVHGFWPKLLRFLNPPADCCTVVCIPPGARLLLCDLPQKVQRKMKLDGPIHEVVFTELDRRDYRDAVRFANGRELSLQKLPEGLRVRVLALSSEESVQANATETVSVLGVLILRKELRNELLRHNGSTFVTQEHKEYEIQTFS